MALEALELLKQTIMRDLLFKQMCLADLIWLQEMKDPRSACGELEGNLGRFIRNKYNLWELHLNGKHPDDFSFEIIQELWIKLNNEY